MIKKIYRQFNQDYTELFNGQILIVARPIKIWSIFPFAYRGQTKQRLFAVQTPWIGITVGRKTRRGNIR